MNGISKSSKSSLPECLVGKTTPTVNTPFGPFWANPLRKRERSRLIGNTPIRCTWAKKRPDADLHFPHFSRAFFSPGSGPRRIRNPSTPSWVFGPSRWCHSRHAQAGPGRDACSGALSSPQGWIQQGRSLPFVFSGGSMLDRNR